MRIAGAIDIGGTRTKVGIVAEDGTVVEKTSIPTSAEPAALVEEIVSAFSPLLDGTKSRGQLEPIVGVSVAGFLDRERETMYGNANLRLLCGFPLKRALEDRLDQGCRLEVDSNASTIAEYRYGAARDSQRLLGVTIGTGLGGGVIVNGALLRYTGECAGDLGHIIVAPNGRRCSCGAHGCLEAMVCSAALSERAGGREIARVIADARAGDRTVVDAIGETGRWLALGLVSLSHLFAPDTIVVGGGVAAAGDLLLEPTRASYRVSANDEYRDRVRIVGSSFEGWEGIVGAASVVFQPN